MSEYARECVREQKYISRIVLLEKLDRVFRSFVVNNDNQWLVCKSE